MLDIKIKDEATKAFLNDLVDRVVNATHESDRSRTHLARAIENHADAVQRLAAAMENRREPTSTAVPS